MSKNKMALNSKNEQVQKNAPTANAAVTRTESSKKGANAPARPSGETSLGRRALCLFLAVLLGISGALVDIPGLLMRGEIEQVYADNQTTVDPTDGSGGTVPADENYSSTIHTFYSDYDPNGNPVSPQYYPTETYGAGYGPYTVDGVLQSNSQTSATTFAAGVPLGTIFIDQSKLGLEGGRTEIASKDNSIIAGLVSISGNQMGYDGTKPNAIKMVPGKINELKGDLIRVIFDDAAVLPNGDRANLVITYSNARIVIDERYNYVGADHQYYHGAVSICQGTSVAYGGTDSTDFNVLNTAIGYGATERTNAQNAVRATAGQYMGADGTTPLTFSNSNQKQPVVGMTIDITYQIMDRSGIPVSGTFVFGVSGVNLDRDPDVLTNVPNRAKPIWYSMKDSFDSGKGKAHSFFSEAMEIISGQESEYVYVRPNTDIRDNPENTTTVNWPKAEYFFANVSKTADGNIKFIGNDRNLPSSSPQPNSWGGNDKSYNAGFVVLANAADGFKVTASGHGAQGGGMNSVAFNSAQIWYRYTSGSGKHGKIEITSEGNPGGNLSVGTILPGGDNPYAEDATGDEKPNTYVVTEGKTVTYTMTPDVGYKAKKITVTGADGSRKEIEFNSAAVGKMKKGDFIVVDTADAPFWAAPTTVEPADPVKGQGILTYEGNGVYTFRFNHARHDEEIYVEWEPTTADILAYKIWADDDDKDGIRYHADINNNLPKFKLQWTKNGRDWLDVTNEMDIGLRNSDNTVKMYTLRTPVTEQTVPAGKVGDDYKDGTYVINNDPNKDSTDPNDFKHPFTWEYLPVYTYDRNGRADRAIQYRIVEIDDPWQYEYEKAKFYEHQIFDLTSPQDNSIEGWGLFTDGINTYAKKGDEEYDDGLYYLVDSDGVVASSPANPQPNKESIHNADASNDYWTEDHAVPYHEAEVKNEHYTSDIYVDVIKFWDDKVIIGDAPETSKDDYNQDIAGYKHNETGTQISPSDYEDLTPEEKSNYSPVYEYSNSDDPSVVIDQATYDGLPDTNEYARKAINIVLHGEIEGATPSAPNIVVDLDPNDPNTTDLIKTIKLNESDNKADVTGYEEVIDSTNNDARYVKYKDQSNNEYAYVHDKENVSDGYYPIVGGNDVDYNTGPLTFNKGAITPIKKTEDGTYKINNDRYGAMFEWLPTHYDGKHIIYTVTETDENGDPLKEWILTGGQLAEVKEGSKLLGYETTLRNTPDVDIEYTPVPLTIHKVDKTTGNPLEGAEFTVYLNPTTKTVAPQSEDLIIGKTIYTRNKNYIKQRDTSDNTEKYYEVNGEDVSRTPADPQPLASELTDTGEKLNGRAIYNSTKDYIIQKDSSDNKYKYYEVISGAPASTPANPQPSVVDLVENGKLDGEDAYTDGTKTYVLRSGQYHLVNAEGNVEPSPASPQPDPNVTRKAKDLKSGVVDKNVVVTDAQGNAEVTFLVPNNATHDLFYIQETNAPEGYYPDPEPYAFKIDADLKTITLEAEDYNHTTPWWKKLYDLLFGNSGDAKLTDENWKTAPDNRGGTFTVEDTPIVADILVRKYWNDNNDQDGKRPGDKNNPTSTSDPNLPKVTLQYTLGAHTAEGSNIYTDGKRYYVHNPADDKYYEVDSPVTTQGSYGGNANPQPQAADLSKTGDTCRGYDVYTDGTTQYVRVGSRYRVVNSVDVRTPNKDSIGTYEYSAANPQPEGATKVNNETCAGLDVYKGTDNNKYVIIDHVYHKVNSIDVTGKVSATPAQEQPDPTDLELMLTGNWVNADGTSNPTTDPKLIADEYRDPRVSYVGGPVLTHQNDAYTWTGLPAYMDGKVVTYRILETGDILDNTKDIYAYDIESNHTSQTHEKTFNLVNNSGSEPTGLNQTVDVTNKHETQVVNIVAYKEWEDEDPEDRGTTGPKLYLYKVLDGIEYPITTLDSSGNIIEDIATVPILGESGEKIHVHTWKDLPTYENGQPVTYRIREEKPYGYITLYEAVYTDRAGNADPKEDTTDIVAEDIRRTFYQRGDSIPDGKKVGDENTTARFDILNERSVNITVDKTWVNGANASVTYELWRTITPAASLTPITRTPVSADDPNVYYVHKTIIITVDEHEALDADEKLKYELKYVNNSNPNDILTVREWSKLDNPRQLEYERKYVNTSDQTDIITIADYGALTPRGKNSYTDLEYYINLDDSTAPTIDETEYNELTPEQQASYSRAYQDNEDASVIITALTYDNLTQKGQNNYAIKYVHKTDPTGTDGIIDEATWAGIPNDAQAEYSKRYVDDRHVIISKDTYATLSSEEQAKYDIEHTSSWSPYANGKKDPDQYALKTDSTTITKEQYDLLTAEQKRLYEPIGMVDGWELVDSHVFDANDFIAPSNTGDKDSWTFNDLLIKDIHGNKYTYRVLEKPALNRFRENQISEYDIINNNVNVSDGNVSLEVVKEVENRKWLDDDQFFFYLEPVKGIDITDPNAPVNIAKDKVPMPYRTDPATNVTTYNYTADALPTDLQVGAIGRAATFQDIQYKENSALYHSIARGDIVEFYYRVYEVYEIETKNVGTNDKETTAKTNLDDATNHSGYKDGITYAGTVSNLTEEEYNELGSIGKDSYMQTSAYVNENADPASIISVTAYNALDEADKANYEATTGYVNINNADDLITRAAYNALPLVGKSAYESQQGYLDKNGKAINEREYSKLSDADKAACTQKTIYSAFIPTVHEARVIAKNVDGIITTETQWLKDGEYKTGAVPVYTNTYSSEGYAKAWIEKKIAEREWVDYTVDSEGNESGDAFSFKVESISGAQLNVPGASSDSYTSRPLMSNETNNPQSDIQKMSDTEYAFGLKGNKYDNTMLNSEGYAYFIYEISENPAVTYKNDDLGLNIQDYTVDGLEYDTVGGEPRKIYARLKAEDNWDGTISFTIDYFSDASCKPDYQLTEHKAWIYDDDTETETGKRLLSMAEVADMGSMSPEERAKCREIYVAYFVNHQTEDIPVIKEWVGGPAIEDVNLHLEQHLFPISGPTTAGITYVNEADITDDYVKNQYDGLSEEEKKAYWQTAGFTHIAERGEFLNNDGTPKYDAGSTDTSSNRYENIDGFNKDLPQYVVKDGVTYRVVYRLFEDDTSNTYERSYKSINVITPEKYGALDAAGKQGYEAKYENKNDKSLITEEAYNNLTDEQKADYAPKYVKETANDYIYTDGDTLVITNTIIATNVAKPAAVKQLQGRNWLDSDDYKFILTPIGKYDKDGTFVSTEEIPMPATDEYVNKTDPRDVISKTAYDALDSVGKDGYEETDDGKYVNKEVDTDIIEASEYAALTEKGQNSYKPKEINDEAHATKDPDTIVDPEGHLERLARFGEIEFSTKDLVYNETDEHYHGDFFYEIKEEIPAGAYAVDKTSLEQILVGENPINFEESFTKAQREQYYWKDPATGIIYDGSIHTVHIKVKENRTSELQVQVAYDETTQGEASTGTQFTPVYTNRYDASISFSQEVDKYIMGRDWKDGDVFDFRMTPVSGAPFVDANESEFHADDTQREDVNYTDVQRDGYLDTKAVHSARGAHVNRLKVEGDAPADTIQKVMMPALKFELSDLHKTVETTGAIKYKDGTDVPAGMAYGQFIYSFEETEDYLKQSNRVVSDLSKDPDTEYVRITVIDKGNGTLDYYTEVFEDRYCTVPRLIPGTTEPAKNPTFVNQLKRELSITKTWVDPATSDITLRLEWSVNEQNWYAVDEAEWLPAGIRNAQIIEKNAYGDALTVTWRNLPAYANIPSDFTTTGNQTGDDKALNDLWVYYRIVEDDVDHVVTRYSKEPYVAGDSYELVDKYKEKTDPNSPHTGAEKETSYVEVTPDGSEVPSNEGWFEYDGENYTPTADATVDGGKTYYTSSDKYVTDRVKQLYVTNWPKDVEGEAKVGIVKQYIGKAWDNEKFTFEIEPIKSMIGSESAPVNNGEDRPTGNYIKTADGSIISGPEYDAIIAADPSKAADYEPEEKTNVMPEYNKANRNEAVATKDPSISDKVSVNEYSANFDPLTIKLSDLAVDRREKIDDPNNPTGPQIANPNYGKAVGTFYYKIKEQIPTNAVEIDEVCGKDIEGNDVKYKVGIDENLNKIKYTTEEHIVKIFAVDEGSGKINIITSFDEREHGEYVPVYTNYAMVETPIEGEKTWIGGEKKDHKNGTVTLSDDEKEILNASDELGLKLQYSLDGETFVDVRDQKDAAGRDLVIVWAKGQEPTTTVSYEPTIDTTVDPNTTYYIDQNGTEAQPQDGDNPLGLGWYEKIETTTTFKYEKQEGEVSTATGKGNSGPYTYTIMAKVTEDVDDGQGGTITKTTYVSPFLNTTDENGNAYIYRIQEGSEPDNYTASYDPTKLLNVTNTYNVKDSLKVTKTWDDAQNAEGLRPDKVIVHLYKVVDVEDLTDAEIAAAEATVVPTQFSDKWTYNGTDYTLEADAQEAADQYQGRDPGEGDYSEITFVSAADQIAAAKAEAVANAREQKNKDTTPVHIEVVRKEITPKSGEKDTWSTGIVWNDLDVYDEKGNVIKYVVIEESVYGYETTYAVDTAPTEYKEEGDRALEVELDGDTTTTQKIDVKNKLAPATNKVEVTKVWDDQNDIDGARPDDVTFILKKYVWDKTLNNGKGGYTTTATEVTKRPATQADVEADLTGATKLGDEITVTRMVLTGTATATPGSTIWNETTTGGATANTWKGEWINLPLTENGKTILYIVEEVTSGEKFGEPGTAGKYSNKPIITGDQIKGYTVTNEYTPEETEFIGIKKWVDGDATITHNNSADLPAKLTLWRTNVVPNNWDENTTWTNLGTLDNLSTTLAPNAHVDWSTSTGTGSQKDDTFTITGLAKKDGNATTYYYKVVEETIEGYQTTYLNSAATNSALSSRTDALYSGGTIENAAKVGNVEITKKFVDSEGNIIPKAALPTGFKIKVTYVWNNTTDKKFEKKTEELVIGDLTPDANGVYKWTLTNVAAGTKVTAEEIGYDSPTGYSYKSTTTTVNGDNESTHLETNPTYAEFTMPTNAAAVDTPPVLRSYHPGTGTEPETPSIAFVNTYDRNTGTIEPVKIWDDNKNAANKRPETLTFTITAKSTNLSSEYAIFDDGQGGKKSSMTFTFAGAGVGEGNDDSWHMNEDFEHQIKNLPTHTADGNQIKYVVEEKDADVPTGYQRLYPQANPIYIELTDGAVEKAEITNAYTVVEITKKWIDVDSTAVRPTADAYKSMIKLYADGIEKTGVVPTVTPNNNGTYIIKWEGLPKKNGTSVVDTDIVYTVRELPDSNPADTVPGYAKGIYSNVDNPNTSTNESSDKTKAYNGGTITNTQLVKVDVKKIWDDNNNHDGQRPPQIKVTLYQNGVPYKTSILTTGEQTLSNTDSNFAASTEGGKDVWTWTGAWTNLPYADANGSVYNYTATETNIDDGTGLWGILTNESTIRQILLNDWNTPKDTMTFTITNSDDEDKIGFTVDKIWDDMSDADKMRPSTIYYRLYQKYDGQTTTAGEEVLVTTLPEGAKVYTNTNTAGSVDWIDATYSNGYIEVTISEDKTQGTLNRVIFDNLPKFARVNKGTTENPDWKTEEIVYIIKEDANISTPATTTDATPEPVFGYTTTITGDYKKGFTIKNKHEDTTITKTTSAIKAISGRNFEAGDEFTFTITPKANAPRPARDYVTIKPTSGKTADINLPTFTFTAGDLEGIALEAGKTKTFEYELAETNGGKTLNDLKYDDSKKTLKITVRRTATGGIEILDADVVWGTGNTAADKTFTNIYGGVVDLTLRKVWIDKDQDGTIMVTRPTSVDFKVTAETKVETTALVDKGFALDNDASTDTKKIYTKTFTLKKADHSTADEATWQTTTGDLPKLDAANNEIKYSVSEDQIPNYNKPVVIEKGTLFTVTNTYESTEIVGTKTWIDPDPESHNNTSEIKFTVKRLKPGEDPTVAANWETLVEDKDYHVDWEDVGTSKDKKFTIKGLAKYVDASANPKVEHQYRVTENAITGYTTKYPNTTATETGYLDNNGGEIKNIIEQEYVEIPVTKEWIGKAVKDVDVNLKSDAQTGTVDTHTFTKAEFDSVNEVTYTFTRDNGTGVDPGYEKYNLDPTSANYGKLIIYSVEETTTGDFTTSYLSRVGTEDKTDGTVGTDYTVKVINDNSEKITVYAQKQWDKDSDAKDERTDVQFRLMQTINGAIKPVDDYEITTSSGTETITGTQTITANKTANVKADAGTVNWPELPKFDKDGNAITYTVEEIGEPDGYTKSEPTGEGTASKPYIIINTKDNGETEVAVRKVWDDQNNQDGKRPSSVTVTVAAQGWDGKDVDGNTVGSLTLSKDNNWTGRFTKLPTKDPNGKKLEYTVDEAAVADYTKLISGNAKDGYTITNRYETAKTSVTATKVWDDGAAGTAAMHQDVILHLYGKIGGRVVYDAGVKKIAKDANPATATWDNLPKYHYSSTELEWEVVEEAVPAYGSKVEYGYVDGTVTPAETKWVESISDIPTGFSWNGEVKVTNIYEGPVTEVSVSKRWEDFDNADGKRPGTVTYELWKKVDGTDSKVAEQTVTVAADGSANHKWTDLPVTEEKVTGTETVQHVQVTLEYVNINDDTDVISVDDYGRLPEAEEKAKSDYEEVVETVITGYREIADPTQEITVDEYNAIVEEDALNGTPNADLYEAITVDETKYVNKSNSEDVITDPAVYDALPDVTKRDYVEKETETPIDETINITEEVAVIYYVKEQQPADYNEPVVVSTGAGTYQVINSRDRELQNLTITKVWHDDFNSGGARPDHITVTLTGTDEATSTKIVELSEIMTGGMTDGTWTYEFKDLPKNIGGHAITYTVDEAHVEHYEKAIDNTSLTIVNSHHAGDMTLTVTKVWKDADGNVLPSQDKEVTFRLIQVIDGYMKDMGDAAAQTIPAGATADSTDPDNDLTVVWTDLASKVGGKFATYTVEEVPIEGYTVTMPDGVIEDEHDSNKLSLTVINTKDPEPEKITIKYIDPLSDDPDTPVLEEIIERGGDEPGTPGDPSHTGYTFTGWKRTVDSDGNVTYTATYAEIPAPEPVEEVKFKVTYVDPKAADGSMILKATKFDASDEADAEAESKAGKPNDPSHDGYTFVGWVKNQDQFGDWILVAKYNETPKPPAKEKRTISYIDPESGNPVILSVDADEAASITPPAPEAHEGKQFIGWLQVTDTAGNTIYVARYSCPECEDCKNTPAPPAKTPEAAPDTGDMNNMMLWILVAVIAVSTMLIILLLRQRSKTKRR